jgi:GNAT acetyltransferase-like protein
MNFPKGLDDFLSSRCRSQRSKLRRKYKRVLNYFVDRLQVRQFCSVADLELAISVMEGIANKSVKRRRFGWGFFDTPQTWANVYCGGRRMAENLRPGGQTGCVLDRHSVRLQADHVGYDPAWSQFSPGMFLFLNILEDLRDADIEVVDFGGRSSQLKQCFGALRRAESQVHI